ncbi:MAG TPA: hypothetical protein VHW47_10760 [Acidimicrobiales bacterium]|nr:hypothetical protein [Acidimicrobiales bacterium]
MLPAGALLATALGLSACDGSPAVTTVDVTPTTTKGVVLSTEQSPVGPILATGSGHTLYDFVPDTPTSSACVSSACVFLWPPLVLAGDQPPTVGHGLRQSLVGEIKRPDGAVQVSYGGHPLYTWNGDSKPGTVTGQAIDNEGGYWYVVAPSGQQITTAFTVDG